MDDGEEDDDVADMLSTIPNHSSVWICRVLRVVLSYLFLCVNAVLLTCFLFIGSYNSSCWRVMNCTCSRYSWPLCDVWEKWEEEHRQENGQPHFGWLSVSFRAQHHHQSLRRALHGLNPSTRMKIVTYVMHICPYCFLRLVWWCNLQPRGSRRSLYPHFILRENTDILLPPNKQLEHQWCASRRTHRYKDLQGIPWPIWRGYHLHAGDKSDQ